MSASIKMRNEYEDGKITMDKVSCGEYLNPVDFSALAPDYRASMPFNHLVIDNFLKADLINEIAKEFPKFNDEAWRIYNNQIEVKKLTNHWDKFGQQTYVFFNFLNSEIFISELEKLTLCKLYPDFGLNGGGLHTHKRGGKLNTHLDYSIHPKLKLERRLNLLIYVTPNWKEEWGGSLGFWSKDPMGKKAPGALEKTIASFFNRAVIFDTSQDSWHGLPEPITCPEEITRNSLAVYYLCEPRKAAESRGKALFAPYGDQAKDPEILALIEKRSQVSTAANVYGEKS